MPSYKKRVHSQRIPQYERAAVMPYDGAYDEKYSSDEENVEYEVCEPEDLTERSNSTVTFSEDIYDSDAIDEMIKNQVRKPSQISQEELVKSDDVQHSDGSKPSKSILKGKGISMRNDGFSPTVGAGSEPPSTGRDIKSVSGTEKKSEAAVVEDGKLSEAVYPGKNDKDKKGEEFDKDVTKPLQGIITDQDVSAKNENEVTKSSQSTIPQHIDQITDSASTNQYNFDRKGQVLEVITKQREEHVWKEKPEKPSPGFSTKGTIGEDSAKISEDVTDESVTKILNAPESGLKDKTAEIISTNILPTKTKLLNGKVPSGENLNEIANKLSEELEKSAAEVQIKTSDKRFEEITMEDAVEEAKKLIEDISQKVQDVLPSMVKPKDEPKVEQETVAENKTEEGAEKDSVQGKISSDASKQMPSKNGNIPSPTKSSEFQKNGHVLEKGGESLIKRMPDISKKVEAIAEYKAQNLLEEGPLKSLATEKLDEKNEAIKAEFSDSLKSAEAVTESKERKNEQISAAKSKVGDIISDVSSSVAKTIEGTLSDITGTSLGVSEGRQEKEKNEGEAEANTEEKQPADKPRVIFRIDSEDDLLSEGEPEAAPQPELSSSTEEFAEKMARELKATIENEKMKLEERLTPLKSGIFDISDESLSKTKELVDERLRKISEIKPPKEIEEPVKKEKSPARTEEIKIGRFHITPALVEEVLNKTKEKEIAERLKTTRGKRETDETQEEVEKELPEKLTEADLEEVIRELKKEGLKTDVYLQPEEKEKEEKKERTLKRVERRFERMASETLEKEMEEAESEEKLDEKREVEFQRMVSNLSSEEVAEYQQEYQQLWEEGGLSSLTPSDDWDSRFPDTPENELEDDTPRKSESIRGSQGTGKKGEPKSSETKKSLKSPISPPKPIRLSDDISPSSLTPVDHSKIGSSPSEIDPTSGFVSEKSEDVPTYDERKKFWEQMSSSQSSETASEIPRSMIESISSNESVDFDKKTEEKLSVKGVKQKFEKEVTETDKTEIEGGLVKSLTESYSKKIAAGELIMPAIPRPKSLISKESPEISSEIFQMPDSPGTAIVSELEVALKSRGSSAPITETVVPGSTASEIIKPVEFIMGSTVITKTPEEVATKELEIEGKCIKTEKGIVPPPSARDRINEKSLEDEIAPPLPARKSIHDRSLSLPPQELADSVRAKKKHFEEVMKKGMIVEQIMTQEETPPQKPKTPEKQLTPEIEEAASSAMTELLDKGVKIAEETLRVKGKAVKETSGKIITAGVNIAKKMSDVPKSLHLKETHAEKSETEDNEKETIEKSKDEFIPSITISGVSRRQTETASIGESEDTQSESDVTPEDARVVDNGDTHWDGSGTQSGGYSPKDDMDYPKETTEKGMGRWIGQEDLSKSNWEKDDLDSSHFKIQTKWERTRSEGASPKEHYVYTPEEHYPDTVWEVPVQEQLEKEEITQDIPLEKQVIIEKDEEEEYEEEEGSREKLTEEEAKEIAEEILEYIQFEVENRSSFLINDEVESPQSITQAQVTDYLRHLAGGKDFDDQDVRLIENLLVKKQRDQFRKTQAANTTASSVDITDEELRSSVNDNDISPVESQVMKLQSLEKGGFAKLSRETTEELEQDDLIKDTTQICKDVEIVDQTIAEVKESLEAAQEQLIEQHKKQKTEIFKKESPSEFKFKGIDYEKTITEVIKEQTSDWETTSEEVKSEAGEEILDQILEELETEKVEKEAKGTEIKEITKRFLSEEQHFKDVREAGLKTADKEKRKRAERSLDDEKEYQTDKGTKVELLKEKDYQKDDLQEDDKTITKKKGEDFTKHKSTSNGRKTEMRADEFAKNLDIKIPENFAVRRLEDQFFSDDSPRSTSDSIKSPPTGGEISGTQYDKQGDVKTDIHFRHPSGATVKADRRSGTDLEPYSSSGESHYHSFEQTSRPCSSDVEVLLAGNVNTAGSSEYESAVSQETSSKQATSADYHTAVSSLSSRESIRSLDSESSGHLASVEVSSEASETLIPSALELEKDVEPVLPDDENQTFRSSGGRHGASARNGAPGKTMDEDFEMVSESEVVSWAGEASEDDGEDEIIPNGDLEQKMKRSYEMTFQPEPMPIAFSESLERLSRDGFVERVHFGVSVDENLSATSAPDERIGSSLEESGSVLSMSLSTTSEPSAVRTVIELSEKMESSLTVSATSIESREDVEPPITVPQTSETSTSTIPHSVDKKTASVTITTSSSDDHGIPSVSTQVTSVSRKSSMADETKSESSKSNDLSHTNGPTQSDYVSEYDDVETVKAKKPQGHKRKESTSNFVPTMIWNLSEAKTQKLRADITELEEEYGKDKYVYDLTLTEKEVKNDEKKESDDLEDQERGRKTSDGDEESKDYERYRLQSQTSKTDSDSGQRPMSSAFSEDQPDSELSELMKQGSSETEKDDPLERPLSPEPEDMENKDITPEFSSEAQASVTELEIEYSGAYSRRDEYASHVSPIREEKLDLGSHEIESGKRLENEKITDGIHSQTSLESTVAEKHELETGEKEMLREKSQEGIANDIPDITVTEHVTPVQTSQKFQYPETKEKKTDKTPDTPASTLSRTSSSSTNQGKEYNLDEGEIKKISKEKEIDGKDEKESLDSPSSDSFEMLDKPDITDEFVIIEEVGREAQENDQEGKSIRITGQKKKPKKLKGEEEDEVVLSPPSPATRMTDLKYFPSEDDSELFPLETDSPPQPQTRKFAEKLKKKSSKEEKEEFDYEQQIEQSKKWIEMQFQGEPAAKIMGAYGYEMEFERAPLEDIKEEDINDLDRNSKIGSMGSQKESLGSFGSVKDSFGSTPDYDVLAGKKYFTRSGEHDDLSMSSLQEFELIEKKLMENGKKSGSSSSQDSLSSKKLGSSSKSGQGDDVSAASLREFEALENACATVVNMEKKAKQEEAILSEIDESHESQISESESCETVSAVIKEKVESEAEDLDKRMFEIDEIIKQAQTNVEKYAELQAAERVESMGRGDSYEEVAKVPDLELDMPLLGREGSKTNFSTQVVTKKKLDEWRAAEKAKAGDFRPKVSDLLENGGKTKSISVDSLEIRSKEKQIIEGKDETISLDSYRSKTQKSDPYEFSEITRKCDSMEEVSACQKQHESSSGDYSSGTEPTHRPIPRADFTLGSNDSLDPSSSTATHATYQYETDSVMSSSFTSCDSNTMVSSMDNLDLIVSGQSVINLSKDFGITKTGDWLENVEVGDSLMKTLIDKPDVTIHREKINLGDHQFVSETVEPLQDETYSHITHKKIQMAPEVEKVVFRGPDADKALKEYIEKLNTGEEVEEFEEVDEHGNVHVKRIIRQRMVIKQDDPLRVQKIAISGKSAEKTLRDIAESVGDEIIEKEEVDEHGNVHVKKLLKKKIFIRPEELTEEIQVYSISGEQTRIHLSEVGPEVQKVVIRGPSAEKALEEYFNSQQLKDKIEEVEEIDEHGNVHIKKILKQHVMIRPEEFQAGHPGFGMKNIRAEGSSRMLTKDELQQYLDQIEEPEFREGESSEQIISSHGEMPVNVQKVTFRGPDAEKQLQEYLQRHQGGEVEEVEEVDEHGNVHIKKILKQRVVIHPEKFQAGHPEFGMKNIEAERSSRILTKDELQQYLDQIEEPEFREGESSEQIISSHGEMPVNVQKVTFRGPDAEKQLQEYLQKHQGGEVEEVEEVDEHGNVHVKRLIKHRMVIRPNDGEDRTQVQKVKFEGPGAELALKNYMAALGSEDEVEEIEEEDEHGNIHRRKVLRQRILIRPEELGDKEITKEGLEEYLQKRSKQTTINFEKIDIGSNEPFVSEIIEPLDDDKFSHTIHRQVEMAPEVQKIVFRGPEAERAAQAYVERLEPGEDLEEREEIDEDGNVHVTRILRRKIVLKPEDLEKRGLSGEELKSYLKQFEMETFEGGSHSFSPDFDPNQKLTQRFSSAFERTEKDRQSEEGKVEPEPSSATKKESGISQRPPLVSDISMDDEAEYDTTEHDWRHQLEILHAEADEDEIGQDLDAALASSVELQKKK